MAALRLIFFCAGLAAVCSAAVEIRFVPPAGDGSVSLGIYDGQGRLVRVLCDEWPFSRFAVGLNGLSTSWDGRDSAGQPVAAGTYRARGYVIGAVEVEGAAIFFNDWLGETGAPRIVSVAAAAVLPGGDLLLAARLSGDRGALLRYSPGSEAPWRLLAEEQLNGRSGEVKLANAADRVFVLFAGRLRAFDLQTGREIPSDLPLESPRDISASSDRLAVLDGGVVRLFGAKDFSPLGEVPADSVKPVAIALLTDGSLVAAGSDGSLWHHDEKWQRLETPDGVVVNALAPGRDSNFWCTESKDGSAAVVQYSPREGRLAEWRSAAKGEEAVALAASGEADYFAAVLDATGLNRTVAIRRAASGGGWELLVDKTITDSASFGWSDGELSAASGELPPAIDVPLAENPLDGSAPRALAFRATADAEGTVLATPDGLPVVRVSDQPGFNRVMVVPGANPAEARFLQGDGAGVEEYALTGLGDITAFDAGTIEMEGGAEKPAPPEEDESAPTP